MYQAEPVRSLQQLSQRLDSCTRCLPLQHNSAKMRSCNSIVFTNIIPGPKEKETVVILRIEQSLNWHIEWNGYMIKPAECNPLYTAPHEVTCLNDVYSVLEMVVSKKICIENSKSEFHPTAWSVEDINRKKTIGKQLNACTFNI